MTRKFSESRKAAFLSALRETGNQTLAAERAKVSRSWVQLHRTEDPAFRLAVEEALRQAQDRLSAHPQRRPPGDDDYFDGQELVVRGTGGSALRDAAGAAPQGERKSGKRVQIARARLKQWSPRVEDRFLTALAASCNVTAACAAVQMTPASAYGHRKRWRGFAARWDEAVEQAYVRLEAGLMEAACNVFSGEGLPPEVPALAPTSFAQAIHLLHMHKHQVHGLGRAPGKRKSWRPKTLDEVGPEILRILNGWQAGLELDPALREADREAWASRRPRAGVEEDWDRPEVAER